MIFCNWCGKPFDNHDWDKWPRPGLISQVSMSREPVENFENIAVKFDQNKPRTDLLPILALEGKIDMICQFCKSHDTRLQPFGYSCNGCGRDVMPSNITISKEAVKFDQEKQRTDLLPILALEEVIKVFTYGAKKYADRNWEKGFNYSRPYGASLRHIFAWWRGESIDPESGISHLAHAVCCLLFLIEFEVRKTGTDNRPYGTDRTTNA